MLTTELFVYRSKKIHGDKYDYSPTVYKRCKEKVKMICKKHGLFEQLPTSHLRGYGCAKCGHDGTRSNIDKFITKARSVHGDKYDYSLAIYGCCTEKVKIICKKHGVFEQLPNSHLGGHGCARCGQSITVAVRKLNTDNFIAKAKNIHGDKYDYSLVVYENSKKQIKIICSIHDIFKQLPNSHLNGSGCIKCGRDIAVRKMTSCKEKFINKAVEVHGNKYDYSLVEYIGSRDNVKIICPEHGIFEQTPSSHLLGSNCPKCSYKNVSEKNRIDKQEFVRRAMKVHGGRYDYSSVNYKSSAIKIEITCLKHGAFKQLSSSHLQGVGCPKCAKELRPPNKLSTDSFIDRAIEVHANKYSYLLAAYTSTDNKVKIICSKHGIFEQAPHSHLNGNGCPECGNELISSLRKSNTTEFINKASIVHNGKYDYSMVDYVSGLTEVKILCLKHGVFYQKPSNHLNGAGCYRCREPRGERKVSIFLDSHNIEYENQKTFKNCRKIKPLHFDFYIPSLNTCIECDGIQHFFPLGCYGGVEEFEKRKELDNIKNKFCFSNGIRLIRIPYNRDFSKIVPFLEKEIIQPNMQV